MTGKTNSSSTDPAAVRRFGIAALAFFGLMAGLGIWRARPVFAAVFGTLAAVGLLCLTLPGPAAPLYRLWMAVAHRIGAACAVIDDVFECFVAEHTLVLFEGIEQIVKRLLLQAACVRGVFQCDEYRVGRPAVEAAVELAAPPGQQR